MIAPDFVRSKLEINYFKAVLAELNNNGIELKSIDMFALGTLAINLALMDESTANLNEFGSIIESQTAHGVTRKANPAIKTFADSQLAARSYYKLFGMSPESRKNIKHDPLINLNDGWDQV